MATQTYRIYRALLFYSLGVLLTFFSLMLMVSVILDVPLILENSHRQVRIPPTTSLSLS